MSKHKSFLPVLQPGVDRVLSSTTTGYTDILTINPDGSVTGWACALNDHLDADVELRDCAAPRGGCPRGFGEAFECEKEPG
jgi:hypothetical protein